MVHKNGIYRPLNTDAKVIETPSSRIWRDIYCIEYRRTQNHKLATAAADQAMTAFQLSVD